MVTGREGEIEEEKEEEEEEEEEEDRGGTGSVDGDEEFLEFKGPRSTEFAREDFSKNPEKSHK